MICRGPDRRAILCDGTVGFGHLLNRITREDDFEAQPLVDSSAGLMLTADARLDNREDLAAALSIAPADLEHLPDSTLILRAYRRWGEDCAQHLLGDFVFAIWDANHRKLVLARDHLGQRSVVFHQDAAFFAFATEARGLTALPDVPWRLDMIRYGAKLIFDRTPRQGATHIEAVRSLDAGCVMTVSLDGAVCVRQYWTPQPAPEHLGRDEAYYVAAYRRVLSEAVACRVRRTTRAPGLLLGGGFDSGAIAGLAAQALSPLKRKLIAVSSVMPQGDPGTPLDARPWVERLARHIPDLDVRYVTREGADIFTGLLDDFVSGGGAGSPTRFANRLLHQALRAAGVRLVMCGDAGDYTLNPRRHNALLLFLRSGRLRLFWREFRAHRAATGTGYAKLFLRDIVYPLLPWRLLEPFDRMRRGLAPFGPAVPISREFLADLRAKGLGEPAGRPPMRARHEALKAMLERTQRGGAPGGSARAAASGMELTLPYLDKRVVELALAIPDTLMFKNGRDRYLARKALADILPAAFQTRGSANDAMVPDFKAMIARAEPKILAELDRMEAEGRLGRFFDLPRIRRMVTGRDTPFRRGRSGQAVEHAARIVLHARHIEWLARSNAPPD